ncbi:hypothetical protein SH139x_000881 [Planctomycetaceae bacterium SH139]
MTAPKHGNRPDSQVQRARGGSPQRIFLSSGTVVDRPPVLFRMPSVATTNAASDPPPDSEIDASIGSTIDAAGEPRSSERAAATLQTPALGEQIVMIDPAVSSHQATPKSDAGISAGEDGGSPPAAKSAEPTAEPREERSRKEESRKEESRKEESRKESTKPRVVETSPLAAVPAGRSWMESYGSRLIPVLLIVAVAAYALLVNNGAESEPEMTLADFEINTGEPLDTDAAVAPANNPLTAPAVQSGNRNQTNSNQTSAEKSGNIALAPPANDPQAATWSGNSEISEVKPDFDLAELMGSPAAADAMSAKDQPVAASANDQSTGQFAADNSATSQFNAPGSQINTPTPHVTVPTPGVNQQPEWQRDLAAAGEAAGIREPEPSATTFNDGVIREGIAAGNAATGQRDSSPIRDNQWVKLDRREQAAPSEQQFADARRQQEAYRPNSEPTAMRAEDAIQAAVDAAVSGQFTSPGEPPAAPNYRMSNQPAGIPDWSRYLPPPQNSSNSGSLIRGMQPNDANPVAVPPEYPGQYPGQYPGSAYGSPGVPQQAYGMPTGYPQQPPATR